MSCFPIQGVRKYEKVLGEAFKVSSSITQSFPVYFKVVPQTSPPPKALSVPGAFWQVAGAVWEVTCVRSLGGLWGCRRRNMPPFCRDCRRCPGSSFFLLVRPVFTGVDVPFALSLIWQDDIIDDVDSFLAAAETLKERGAYKIFVMATHGLLSSDAPRLIEESAIDEVVVLHHWAALVLTAWILNRAEQVQAHFH